MLVRMKHMPVQHIVTHTLSVVIMGCSKIKAELNRIA